MKKELTEALKRLRNEWVQGAKPPSPVQIAQQLKTLGLDLSAAEMASLIPMVLKGPESALQFVPPDLLAVMAEFLSGMSARVVCDHKRGYPGA